MGKSIPTSTTLQNLATKIAASKKLQGSFKPTPVIPTKSLRSDQIKRSKMEEEESSSDKHGQQQAHKNLKLSQVVNDCVKRWFQDTLKEAKAGDSAMQVLVGQMYFSGYGVPRDPQKGRAWISKASKSRSSALHVGDKHPGYNASDSDSDKLKDNPQ
ncbi:hypothetical protein RJ641_005738 [Dillenia turbinata]|uniref:Uncharacterized protein n=1 Tax=Dillenia turbinata TaxID=194707 RepID=A0AAN8VL19_9MAGN